MRAEYGRAFGFRSRGEAAKHLELARRLRMNLSAVVNEVLDKHAAEVAVVVEERKRELRKLLAPVL